MDKGYENERFESLSIKTSVARKFRSYCKAISKSQSMSLLHMVDFFELNGVSPEDNLGETITSLKRQIIKRSNAVIAIIKNIEKTHHKPTTAILQSLFEETAQIEKEEEDGFDFGTPALITENEELEYYRKEYYNIQQAYRDLVEETEGLLKKIQYVRNNFGMGHYRLNATEADLKRLQQKLDHVHHHNTTEAGR